MSDNRTLEQRLLAKTTKTDSCWLWTGGRHARTGLGVISVQGKQQAVHRVAYELWGAPIPDGFQVDHTCGVRHCVNLAHLMAVPGRCHVGPVPPGVTPVFKYLLGKFTIGDGCWEWTAGKNAAGYGVFKNRRWPQHSRLAHRVLYTLLVGPIPAGLELDHLCRNRGCVNPKHLEPVTRRVNTLRGETRGARNAAVTHCPQGHAYDERNTWTAKNGSRNCRRCNADRQAQRKERLRAAAT